MKKELGIGVSFIIISIVFIFILISIGLILAAGSSSTVPQGSVLNPQEGYYYDSITENCKKGVSYSAYNPFPYETKHECESDNDKLPIIDPSQLCEILWSGYEYNELTGKCELQEETGACLNPFDYLTIEECEKAHRSEIYRFLRNVQREQRSAILSCKKDCTIDRRTDLRVCNSDYKECRDTCRDDNKECLTDVLDEYKGCKAFCYAEYDSSSERRERSECLRECLTDKSLNRRNCNMGACVNTCSSIKKSCTEDVKFEYPFCKESCNFIFSDEEITCEDGKYNAGDVFLEDCEVCRCNYNKRVDCKSTKFCNFEKPEIDETTCSDNGGFYYKLCNGPYFDIVCSSEDYCLCDGLSDFSCPTGYECIHEFNTLLPRTRQTIPGFKDLLGHKLGDIGICVENPGISSCGDGNCDNLCDGLDCSMAETIYNCPADCS